MKKNISLGRIRPHAHSLSSAVRGPLRRWWILLLFLCLLAPLHGAQLKQARVTQVVRDVKLLPGQAAPRPAAVSDDVREGTAVRTGLESRAELTFTDQTLARLGANTIFSFDQGTRNLELSGGAMLLRVPKNAGGAQINTAAVTAAITGTTMMLEYHPDAFIKAIMLEGTARIFRKGHLGDSVLLHPGQMMIINPKGKGLPDPVDVDLDRLMKTSLLINGFPPLQSSDLIARAISTQTEKKSEGGLIETNLVIFGGGTAVSLLDPTQVGVVDQANANEERQPSESPSPSPTMTPTPTATMSPTPTATATVTPTPSKFGTPSVIASSTPYEINSGTTITTDPTITTNGVTDFGKLYRGSDLDGSASTYLFGSTSAFDTEISFDERIGRSPDTLPIAVFKFTALRLAGNPTISLANGGVPNLALISVGDITSGSPGGVLTLDGIDALLLATEDGSITLGSEISFEGIPRLFLYARGGTGATLTLDSAISGTTDLTLISEGAITFNNPFNLTESEATDDGLHFDAIAGTDLLALNGLTITLDNADGGDTFEESARILISPGQDLTADGESGLNLTIANNNGGHIGGDASIEVFTGGDLTAESEIDLTIDNSSFNGDGFSVGGDISSNAMITLSTGSVSVGGGFFTFLFNDGGGHIGGEALITGAFSGNFTTGGDLFFDIQNSAQRNDGVTFTGGTIDGNASVTIDVGGNITSGGVAEFAVLNNDFRFVDGGGTISGDASVFVTAGNIASSGFFQPLVNNTNGNIGGSATVQVTAGDITIEGETFFNILNTSGLIGDDALNSLIANNYSTGSLFQFQILNANGSIGASAFLTASLSGGLTIGGDASIQITNDGGAIGGDASIFVSAASFSANSLLAQIDNANGSIGGGSFIVFVVDGSLATNGNATFTIQHNGSNASADSIGVVAGSINVGGSLSANIFSGESLFNADNVSVFATGNIIAGGEINVGGNVTAGGDIIASGQITGNGGSVVAGGDIFAAAGSIVGFPSIIAGGSINGAGLFGNTASAGTDIIVGSVGAFVDTITAAGVLDLNNTPAVRANTSSSDGSIGFTPSDFTLTATAIVSSGPTFPLLSADGSDASISVGNNNPGNGGVITIQMTGGGLTIGPTNDLRAIEANGGRFANSSTAGGNGGTVDITATGDVTLLPNGDITATSGVVPSSALIRGDGGTVNITTPGAITVSSKIEVSSNDVEINPIRRSAKGGNINLTSNKTTSGAAITVSNSGQLLALLDQAAPGPGGKITILATGGGGSSVNVHGSAVADRGTVDIRHTGLDGTVNLGDASGSNSVFLHGDVVKAGALGTNGVLTVGQGFISADDTLKLYGASANGEVRFIDNVSIGGQNFTIIAANTVTIVNGKTVTINGARADVFTGFNGQGVPNANYTGFGGNNSTTGTFGGAGANDPQPIGNAPPFDGPPGG